MDSASAAVFIQLDARPPVAAPSVGVNGLDNWQIVGEVGIGDDSDADAAFVRRFQAFEPAARQQEIRGLNVHRAICCCDQSLQRVRDAAVNTV